jgi:sulfoxide reductase heme-binding subunit YedZ
VLTLTPLRVLLPHSRLVNALNRHRRVVGVSACIYGLFHFTCHILYEGGWDGLLQSFTKPFIWFGLGGLMILLTLALTSNQWSIRTLGGKNWKRLHRLAYVAAALLIYHWQSRVRAIGILRAGCCFRLLFTVGPSGKDFYDEATPY